MDMKNTRYNVSEIVLLINESINLLNLVKSIDIKESEKETMNEKIIHTLNIYRRLFPTEYNYVTKTREINATYPTRHSDST